MNKDVLNEKLYTSTEVAEILGVSLRSIYRYLEEDKIKAAVKTATGRHRFTKQNINDFLYPSVPHSRNAGSGKVDEEVSTSEIDSTNKIESRGTENSNEAVESSKANPKEVVIEQASMVSESHNIVEEIKEEEPVEESSPAPSEEPVDWLAKFRQAAQKYKEEEAQQKVEQHQEAPQTQHEEQKDISFDEAEFNYYRSGVGGLKEVAQSLDKSAKNASLEYAFTMNAGLSLHKPIKPFSVIHSYIRTQDKNYFEKALQLAPASKDSAQLCLVTTKDDSIFDSRNELHGLFVVSNSQLKKDLINEGEGELAQEIE